MAEGIEPNFAVGSIFQSFLQFENALKSYQARNFVNFTVYSSDLLNAGTDEIIESFKFRRVLYKCKFHGAVKQRDDRKRKTRTSKKGCESHLKVSYKKCGADRTAALTITALDNVHNYELSQDLYMSLPRQRTDALKKNTDLLEKVLPLKPNYRSLQVQLNATETVTTGECASSSPILLKDIYNYRYKQGMLKTIKINFFPKTHKTYQSEGVFCISQPYFKSLSYDRIIT